METITYGEIQPRVGIQSVARLLKVGQPLLVTQRFAQQEDAKSRSGNTIKWRRYHAFTVSAAPLAEGVPPSVQPLNKTDYTAVMRQYGAVSELTDVCYDLHEDNALGVCVTRCGEQMAQTMETLAIDVLKAGTNVYYASSAASRTALVATVGRTDLRLLVRGFNRDDAMPISKIIGPTSNVSTRGVEASYFGMCHTDLKPDLRNMTGFQTYIEYGTPNERLPGEIGACEEIRFICTRMFTPWLAGATGASGQTTFLTSGSSGTGSADVYPILVVARDAYGVVRLQGRKAVGIQVLQPNKARGGDPLGQKGTVGWKAYFAAAILNEDWIARLEVLCTASPS